MSLKKFYIRTVLPDGSIVNLPKYYDTVTQELIEIDISDSCNFIETPETTNLDINCVTFCAGSEFQQNLIAGCQPSFSVLVTGLDIMTNFSCCSNPVFELYDSSNTLVDTNSTGAFTVNVNGDYSILLNCQEGMVTNTVTV